MRVAFSIVFVAVVGAAQAIEKTADVMIPMRDGVKLHTEVWRDNSRTEPLPFIITRSPYGWSRAKNTLDRSYDALVKEGYIFIFQDIRGRYQSEGIFVMQRPIRDRKLRGTVDEGSDTYDTIDWLLKNVPSNNGRAGILGISYGGWLTVMALLEPHPALKAASEQASPADMFLGDDFHHNGAFRLSYGYEYASMMETGKENAPFKFDRYDTYDWYLALGPLSEANRRYLDRQRPTWNNFVAHPNYDSFWQAQAVDRYVSNITVPNLNVAGWFDQEDFYGPVKIYETAEKNDSQRLNHFVAGPWNHGGWGGGDGRTLGKIDFGSDTARYYRDEVQAPWFAYWLKDKGTRNFPEALAFQTGTNEWKRYDSWPPKSSAAKPLYFREDGKLSFEKPQADAGSDEFVSDPRHPVPYRNRPIPPTYGFPGWSTWLVDDQRFVHGRPDVLVWQTDPLEQKICIAGDVFANLYASTTGTDADWIAKLIDVYPALMEKDPPMGGYELMIGAEVLRGRFRESFEKPKQIIPNQPVLFKVDLRTHNHCFLPGHRIMAQVQSTWFPLIDRNPQTFVANIFEAKESDFKKATHRVLRTKQFASHLLLPMEAVR